MPADKFAKHQIHIDKIRTMCEMEAKTARHNNKFMCSYCDQVVEFNGGATPVAIAKVLGFRVHQLCPNCGQITSVNP